MCLKVCLCQPQKSNYANLLCVNLTIYSPCSSCMYCLLWDVWWSYSGVVFICDWHNILITQKCFIHICGLEILKSVLSGGRCTSLHALMFSQWAILSFSRPTVRPWISSNSSWHLFSSSGGIKVDSILMWALYWGKLDDLELKSRRLKTFKKDFYGISHLSILPFLRRVNLFLLFADWKRV